MLSPSLTLDNNHNTWQLSLKFNFNIFVSYFGSHIVRRPNTVFASPGDQCWFWDRVSFLALLKHLCPSFFVSKVFFSIPRRVNRWNWVNCIPIIPFWIIIRLTQCECNTFSVSLIYLAIDHCDISFPLLCYIARGGLRKEYLPFTVCHALCTKQLAPGLIYLYDADIPGEGHGFNVQMFIQHVNMLTAYMKLWRLFHRHCLRKR